MYFKWQSNDWKLLAYSSVYSVIWREVGIEMYDFANISSRTIVYAAIDDFSGNALMGPTIPNQYKM